MAVPNPLRSKKTHFAEELKIVSKWANMLDERKYYNIRRK